MAGPIVADVGAADANSFVTVEECDTYCDNRLNASAWNEETDEDQKIRALIEATRTLNLARWHGHRVNDTQSLSWPREWAPDPDLPESEDGLSAISYFPNDEVPQRVKDATCELALEFLRAGTTDLASEDQSLHVKRKKIDVIETEWVDPGFRTRGLGRFTRVMSLISPLLQATGGLDVVRV